MKLGTIQDFDFAPQPFDASTAWDVAVLAGRSVSGLRVWAAALRVMWGDRNKWRPKATISSCGWDMGKLGSEVADELLARGCTVVEIKAAGEVALAAIQAKLPGAEAITAAEGFSEAAPAEQPARP